MAKKKVVAAGHISLDLTPSFSHSGQIMPAELFVPGKLIQMGNMHMHPGGAVSNTGLAMYKLGADVTLMGKVGNDALGTMIRQFYEEKGARVSLLISEEESTSYTIVLAPPGVDRIFLHAPGPNHTFSFAELDISVIEEADLFHFGYPPLMKYMYRNGGRMLTDMYRTIDQMGVMTSLDLAAVDAHSDAADADWETILRHTLPYVDFFVPSAEELYQMLDQQKYRKLQELAAGRELTDILSVEEDIRPLAEQAVSMGASVVLIKCGSRGMYYKTARNISELEDKYGASMKGFTDQEGFEQSYMPEKVLSGTGAGDTTIGAFLTAMLEGYEFHRCIQLAAATGASCVEAYDSLSGLKSFEELENKIRKGWAKQQVPDR